MKEPTLYNIIVKSDDCYLFHLLIIWCINTYTRHIKIIKTIVDSHIEVLKQNRPGGINL